MVGTGKRRQDLVCNICGDVGYADYIATCCQCKQVSEHIYCMQSKLYEIPETWTCEQCPSAVSKFKKIEITSSNVKRLKPDDKRSYKESFRQLTDIGELPHKAQLLQHERIGPSSVKAHPVDRRTSVTRDVQKQLTGSAFPSPSTIDKAAEKCLPVKDVSAQTFGGKSTVTNIIPSLGASVARMNQHKIICSKNLNMCKTLYQPKEEDTDANEESGSVRNYGTSGKDSLPALIKTEPCEEATYPQMCKPLDHTDRILSAYCADAPPLGINNVPYHSPIKKCSGQNIQVSQLPQGGIRELPNERAINFLSPFQSGNAICSTIPEKKLPLLVVSDGAPSNFFSTETAWMGELEIFGVVPYVCEGVEARLPSKVCLFAYEQLKKMPIKVKLKPVHRLDVWPKPFQVDPPMVGDVAFFLFPCEFQSGHCRLKEKYSQLIEQMSSGDLALQTRKDAVELLIFTSKELPKDANFLH
ncbi:Zinc finger RING/FYVE/PHD-type protein [Dioscorea alata]|uniref:Zinc finger RING/FYVE/PHD-type protein n=1 Tax=Dioscorea alata TaxID=55571 RepID=A0ACB7VH97_DIOAL|nr:Zinc finger RING/FYVE/PHD-type protein [Dioscorea alata]